MGYCVAFYVEYLLGALPSCFVIYFCFVFNKSFPFSLEFINLWLGFQITSFVWFSHLFVVNFSLFSLAVFAKQFSFKSAWQHWTIFYYFFLWPFWCSISCFSSYWYMLVLLSFVLCNISLSFVILRFLIAGTIQGLHNIHGSFNVPNMPSTLASRNSTISNVPSGGVQQPTGSLSSGRFASNNLPVALSQVP